jgi:hypothetical protein
MRLPRDYVRTPTAQAPKLGRTWDFTNLATRHPCDWVGQLVRPETSLSLRRHTPRVDADVSSILSEAESGELAAERSDAAWWDRTALVATVRAHPTAATFVALVGLAGASFALHLVLVGWVSGPWVFMDELGYQRMAQSFAHTGHFLLFGKRGLSYSPLYPIVLSPIYALTSSPHIAYEWAKVVNAALMSLSVFPVYAIARFALPPSRSVGVATLSLIAPLMLYSGFEMSESLAYPLCLVAIWAMLRAVRRPTVGNDVLLLGAIALASSARLQFVALLPAALTAILLVPLLRRNRPRRRLGAVLETVSQHRVLFAVVAVVLMTGLVRSAMNGGKLPLAGRYADVGTSHASPLRVSELFIQHLGELDFAVGVVPFAAAILAGYALVQVGFPRNALVFASVAFASTFWLLLEVAYDAAAFDPTSAHVRGGTGFAGLPRIHERYLIYLIPLFLVALVAALPRLRGRIPARHRLLIAGAAVSLPLLIPFGTAINSGIPIDSFALQIFGRVQGGQIVPIGHPALVMLALSGLIGFAYVRAPAPQAGVIAVSITTVALFAMSVLALGRHVGRTPPAKLGLPAHASWVDRIVDHRSDVSLVEGTGVRRIALEETAYWNMSIGHVYYICKMAFGQDFGETRLTLSGSGGLLRDQSGRVHTRYAVVPAALEIPGRVIGRDRAGGLVLVAPSGGMLRIPRDRRVALRCPS